MATESVLLRRQAAVNEDSSSDLHNEAKLWLGYVEKYYSSVFDYVGTLISDGALAEEVSKLAFRRLWENLDCVSGDAKVESFLFMVARTWIMDMTPRQSSPKKD